MTIDFERIERETKQIELAKARERTTFLFDFCKKIKQVNIHYNGELTKYFGEDLKKILKVT